MAKRVCVTPGCPELVDPGTARGRCKEHRRGLEEARGTAAQRGYGAEHRRIRADWKRRMKAGEQVICWRCQEEKGLTHAVDPDLFDLGHDDHNRGVYRGPECRRGNRAAPRYAAGGTA